MKQLLISTAARTRYKDISGIYYILYQDEIIYIGQSKNIYTRLTQHANANNVQNILKKIAKEKGQYQRTKELALYMFIAEHREEIEFRVEPYAIELLNEVEEQEIISHKPIYNYGGVDIPFTPVKR